MEEKIKNGNVVDLSYLNDLSRGNKAFVKEMLSIFMQESPAEMNSIENAINDSNFELIKSTSHKLKSTIPFVGLDKIVGTDVMEMEALAANRSNIEQIKTHFSKVRAACAKAFEELGPMLNEL
jgi:HPt (histidine-containing phosphotransfer) domain-containing protein